MTNPGFRLAKDHFEQNLKTLTRPENDPAIWNMSSGLAQLAAAIEEELEAIHVRLRNVESAVRDSR